LTWLTRQPRFCVAIFLMTFMLSPLAQASDAPLKPQTGLGSASGVASSIPKGSLYGGTVFNEASLQLAKAGWFAALRRKTVGYCLGGVQDALDAIGIKLPRLRAAADLAAPLARDTRFQELSIRKQELAMLPPGAIVVWSKSKAHPYGHVSITQGSGQESSDHIQPIKPGITPSFRVFIPKG